LAFPGYEAGGGHRRAAGIGGRLQYLTGVVSAFSIGHLNSSNLARRVLVLKPSSLAQSVRH